jgi:hypothetical protein
MANIESTPRKLVLKQASLTLTFDKDSGQATLQQKVLLWNKKPIEFALADIDDIAVGQGRPLRCVDPSQRVAQAVWRDHGANHRRSQGCRGHGKEAAGLCRALVLNAILEVRQPELPSSIPSDDLALAAVNGRRG